MSAPLNGKPLLPLLHDVLANTQHPAFIARLLKMLLTETELKNLEKRLHILSMLEADATYSEIQEKLNVSSATIAQLTDHQDTKLTQKLLHEMQREARFSDLIKPLARLVQSK